MCRSRLVVAFPKRFVHLGADVVEVDVHDENFALPKDVDLAFITIHGTFGEDGQLQKILEERGVPYTGDGVEASRAAFDKILSKEKFREHDVVTPEWEVVEAGQRPTISVPLVVKPRATGFHRWRGDCEKRERT